MGFIFYGASGCASWCSVPVSKKSTITQLCSLQYTRSRRRSGSHSTVPALGSSAPFSSTPILQSCSHLTLPAAKCLDTRFYALDSARKLKPRGLERRELIERSEEYRSSISKPKRHPALRKTNQRGSKRNLQKSEQIYFHG